MNKPTDFALKIADTPTDDRKSSPPPAPTKAIRRRGRPRDVKRLTPEDMELEIERIHRLYGKPTLARDTQPD